MPRREGTPCFRRLLLAAVVVTANRLIRPNIPTARHALLDETAHLATALLALDALAHGRSTRFQRAALLGSVAIDLDHVPDLVLGWRWLMGDSPRPYPHSLPTLGLLAVLARTRRSEQQRDLLAGAAFGVSIHLLRDLTDGSEGVPLLWPISGRGIRLSRHLQWPLLAAAVIAPAVSAGGRTSAAKLGSWRFAGRSPT
jgi:membrane-bound metal-dependent hydrolase YbcI (DUF457 family)